MSRCHITFSCAGDALVGTIDDANGATGLLLVSGGNETRAGAFSGQAQLAARLAAIGFPVFRYDRRGVGDSEGDNHGFRDSAEDISAALVAFRTERPALERIIGFGNCDAASALMLASGAGCDALVLANPWTFENGAESPPPDAVRARYSEKLKNPREVLRLLTGGVSLKKLGSGLMTAIRPAPPPSSLAKEMEQGLAAYDAPWRVLLAGNDRTAKAFMAACPTLPFALCEDASHAFAEEMAREWLFGQLVSALQE